MGRFIAREGLIFLSIMLLPLSGCSKTDYESQKISLERDRLNLDREKLRFEIARHGEEINNPPKKWSIYKSDDWQRIIMYEETTGESWRLFLNKSNNGEIEDEGWTELNYKTGYGSFKYPKTANEYALYRALEKNKKEAK